MDINKKNPFMKDGTLDITASINKVVIGKMPTDVVHQNLAGKSAIDIFSTNLMIEEIKKHAVELSLSRFSMEEKMLPHYLEECLSSDQVEVRRTATDILRIFGERLAVLFLCLQQGNRSDREARPDWTTEHWDYWKQVQTVILVGGLANSYLGETLKCYAEKVFFDAGEPGYQLILGNDSAYAGLRGCAHYLQHTDVTKVNLLFDFGQTYTKRSYVRTNQMGKRDIRILDNILSKHVAWDVKEPVLEQQEAVLLHHSFVQIILTTIEEVKNKGLQIGEEIIISIANYIKQGCIVNRGGYGKLRLVADNYALCLVHELQEATGQCYKITMVHDGTAMAAEYTGYKDAVCISLGTAFGVGFP
ncbi:MAG: hypothetical protein RRX92_07605 [Lachnospiraceae bacterium]